MLQSLTSEQAYNHITLLAPFITGVCHAQYKNIHDDSPGLKEHFQGIVWDLVMLAIGGVCFVIARFVIHTLNKTSNNRTINRIRKDPAFAHRYSDTLDIPYSSRPISENQFIQIRQQVHEQRRAGDYRVLLNCNFGKYRFLIFTEFSFVDYDIQVTGLPDDTRKKSYHNFIVEYDPAQQMLKTFSNLYSTSSEKLQKEGLLNAMLPLPNPRPVYNPDDFDEDDLDEEDDDTELDYDDIDHFKNPTEKG